MEETGMITVQQICVIHRVLMDGLHDNAGEIRTTVTYTIRPDGEKYYYTPPERVEDRLYTVVDRHNEHMEEIHNLNLSRKEKVVMTVKAAAWLLLNFVDTHPFSDGNGRMSRLLAGYTIMIVNPFPVQPYHNNEETCRSDYISAIVHCSENQCPSRIAALLVDGLYTSWSLA
uniref:Fido domain-containing protein n=1 Tax=Amphimedon queenslandica TaxID=400682 RepID=A0A1X7USG0_AMPQE